ncbi:MAG: type II toxin-antitoxin system prevent-host-death family antitoxin [Caldisericaceae bacterium]
MYEVINASDLKRDLLEILKRVEDGESFLVIRKSKPSAYIVRAELFESLIESVKLASNKEFMKKLLEDEKK